MSKPILIIKTGNTIESLLANGEDFENWFATHSGLGDEHFSVRSLHKGEELDPLENISGVIITGSPAYVTDLEAWNFIGAEYIKEAHAGNIPILGVCYGHQLIAWAFDGVVDFHPLGREIGTVGVTLTDEAKSDPLFKRLPDEFLAQVSHQQSVTSLPPQAIRLGGNSFETNQAFRLGDQTWGIQFHPEFSAATIRAYIEARWDAIKSEGLDPESLHHEVRDTPEAESVLRAFCRFVFNEN